MELKDRFEQILKEIQNRSALEEGEYEAVILSASKTDRKYQIPEYGTEKVFEVIKLVFEITAGTRKNTQKEIYYVVDSKYGDINPMKYKKLQNDIYKIGLILSHFSDKWKTEEELALALLKLKNKPIKILVSHRQGKTSTFVNYEVVLPKNNTANSWDLEDII